MAASRLITLAFFGFIGLGIPKAAFGTAWPSVADDLNRDIAELGVVLVVFIAGYFAAATGSGELIRRVSFIPARLEREMTLRFKVTLD